MPKSKSPTSTTTTKATLTMILKKQQALTKKALLIDRIAFLKRKIKNKRTGQSSPPTQDFMPMSTPTKRPHETNSNQHQMNGNFQGKDWTNYSFSPRFTMIYAIWSGDQTGQQGPREIINEVFSSMHDVSRYCDGVSNADYMSEKNTPKGRKKIIAFMTFHQDIEIGKITRGRQDRVCQVKGTDTWKAY